MSESEKEIEKYRLAINALLSIKEEIEWQRENKTKAILSLNKCYYWTKTAVEEIEKLLPPIKY